MSYWEIWNSFTKVKRNWEETRDLLLSFNEFLTQKASIERDYAAGLLRLTRCSLFTKSKNSIDPSLKRLQICCSQQSLNLNSLITQQQTELIPAIKSLLAAQDEKLKAKARYAKDFESELQKTDNKVEKSKEMYFETCDLCRVPGKVEEMAEKKYFQSVEQGNKFLKAYEENMKPVFELFQSHDEEKVEVLKESLRKFIIYEMAYTRSVQYELELLPSVIDLMDPKKESLKFIYDAVSLTPFRPYVIEIHPKCISTELSEYSNSPKEIVAKVLNKCWSGICVSESEILKLAEALLSNEARDSFVNKIIEKRNREEFVIPAKTFLNTCNVFNLLLDKSLQTKDFSLVNQVFEVFQCFYQETHKKYLHEVLSCHPVWEAYKVWSKVIVTTLKSDALVCAGKKESLGQIIKLNPADNKTSDEYLKLIKHFNEDSKEVEDQDYDLFTLIQLLYMRLKT